MGMLGYSCPTPANLCFGSLITDGLGGQTSVRVKYHQSHIDGQNCYGKYLVSQGYEKLEGSRRDFRMPNGGGILTLPKKIGIPVVSGKRGDSGASARTKRAQGKHRNIGSR